MAQVMATLASAASWSPKPPAALVVISHCISTVGLGEGEVVGHGQC